MASNVIGTPITDETLKKMPEYYDKPVTRVDRARVALDMKNAEGKDIDARKFGENLRRACSERVKTMGLIYNATGGPMTLASAYDWSGQVCDTPYPVIIENGQWGAFLHGGGSDKSRAGVSYSAKIASGVSHDWLISWCNPVKGNNQVYVENHNPGHYDPKNWGTWNALDGLLTNSRTEQKYNDFGAMIRAEIGTCQTPTPIFEALLTLPEALRDK